MSKQINYKTLNYVLDLKIYLIPNKSDMMKRVVGSKVFSNFDLKSVFWKIGIPLEHQFKAAFVVPNGNYEWKVMPFVLKNPPSQQLKVMEYTFKPYMDCW